MRTGSRHAVAADDASAAGEAAVRILRGAAQTELTLRAKLQARGFTGAAARAAAAEMARRGYVDDAEFARSLTARRLARGYGRGLVAAELRARGVGEIPIDDSLRAVGAEEERAAAVHLALRLLSRDRDRHGADDPRTAGRVAAALGRRGHAPDVIRAALREAWNGATDAGPD